MLCRGCHSYNSTIMRLKKSQEKNQELRSREQGWNDALYATVTMNSAYEGDQHRSFWYILLFQTPGTLSLSDQQT